MCSTSMLFILNMCEPSANKTYRVIKCHSSFYDIQENFIICVERSSYQCIRSNQTNCGYLLLKESQGENWSYHAVFVFNTLILLLSGIINIFLCKRLRRTSELHAAQLSKFQHVSEVSDPSLDTPASDASSSLDQVSSGLNLNYTTLQFPEDDTSKENSLTERRKTRRNPIYSSIKCQVSNITEES